MNTKQYEPRVLTLIERLNERGFKRIVELDADKIFPLEIFPGVDTKCLFDNRPLVIELEIVDKAEFDSNYKLGKVYVVYRK